MMGARAGACISSVVMPQAALCGPTTVAVNFVARGPLKIFGAGLLPAGWAALVGAGASEFADMLVNLEDVAGPVARRALHTKSLKPSLASLL